MAGKAKAEAPPEDFDSHIASRFICSLTPSVTRMTIPNILSEKHCDPRCPRELSCPSRGTNNESALATCLIALLGVNKSL